MRNKKITAQQPHNSNFFQSVTNWNWKRTASALLIGTVLGTLGVLVYDKYRVRDVICQVAGVDAENGIIAARCMLK